MKHPEYFRLGIEFIASMKELQTHYRKAIEMGVSKQIYAASNDLPCLLCNPLLTWKCFDNIAKDDEFLTFKEKCTRLGCPWIVMTGLTCCGWSEQQEELKHHQHIYSTTNTEMMQKRIEQLSKWIAEYEQHLEVL